MHGLLLLSDERNWPCHRSRGGPQGPLYHECALYSKLFIFETPGLILYSKPFISKLIYLIILYTLNTTTLTLEMIKDVKKTNPPGCWFCIFCICILCICIYISVFLLVFLAQGSPRSVNPWPPAPPSSPCHREYTSDRIQNAQNTSDSEYIEIQCHRMGPQFLFDFSLLTMHIYGEIDILGRTIMHQIKIFIKLDLQVIVNWLFIEQLNKQ